MAPSTPQTKNKRFMLLIVIPLISCILSSVIGILFGQVGNLFYAILGGGTSNFLTFSIFCGLFFVTFGLSLFLNWLLKKWLVSSKKAVR